MMRLNLWSHLALVLTVVLIAAGCGGGSVASNDSERSAKTNSGPQKDANDGDGGDGPSETSLRKTFEENVEFIADHDFEAACAVYTEEYWDASLKEARTSGMNIKTEDCERGLAGMIAFAEGFGVDFREDMQKIDELELAGDKATIEASNADGATRYEMVYQDDRWLFASETDLEDEEKVEAAEQWMAGWCKLEEGQTREAAIKIMGEPTTEYTATEATPQLNWEAGAYHFTAFLDTDGIVKSFYANYDDLGKTDMAKMACAPARGTA